MRGYVIELIHRESDPGMWIVRRSKKILWFTLRISSDWFTDNHQALTFADKLQRADSAK